MRHAAIAADPRAATGVWTPVAIPCFLIGFYFAFRIMIVVIAVRVLGTDPQAGAAASLVLNFLLLMLAAFCALGAAQRSLISLVHLPSVRWVIAFLVISGCSLSWTVAASRPAAIAFWCAMLADVAMVLLLLRAGPATGAAHALMKGYVWGACAVALVAWIMPAQSDLRLGDEELLGPNQIGYVCALAFFFAQFLALRKDGTWRAIAAFLAITLLRSLSKTTIIAFVISEAFFLIRDSTMKRRIKIWLSIAAAVIVLLFSSLLASYFETYTNSGNQSETLSGRLGIWAYFFTEAIQYPWLGHGFHSVWKVIPPFGADAFEARHAHNEMLQLFYAYGVVGLMLFLGIYGSLYLQIRRICDSRVKAFFLALLLFVLIRGLTDTEAFDISLPLWAIAAIGTLMEPKRPRDGRTNVHHSASQTGLSQVEWKT